MSDRDQLKAATSILMLPATFLANGPSLNAQRRTDSPGPYLLLDGTSVVHPAVSDEASFHAPLLREIHTLPRSPAVGGRRVYQQRSSPNFHASGIFSDAH